MLGYIQRQKDRLRPVFFPESMTVPIAVVNQQDIPTQLLQIEQPIQLSPSPVIQKTSVTLPPSSPTTPPSPKTPVPTPSPPTQFETEEEYHNPVLTPMETQQSPIKKIKTTIAPVVLRTVGTRSRKPEPKRNKFSGMSWEELNNTLHGLYPEYIPGILDLEDFDVNEAYENVNLLTDLNKQQIPELFLIKDWIKKLTTTIIDYNDRHDSDSDDETYLEILEEVDEFK